MRRDVLKALGARMLGCPRAPPPTYVQAIPLYAKADEVVSEYFEKNHDEINEMTGSALVILMPQEVKTGDPSLWTALFGSTLKDKRYPGLRRGDLPCVWLEDGAQGHAIIRLPDKRSDLLGYVRFMTDAAEETKSAPEIRLRVLKWIDDTVPDRSPLMRFLLARVPMQKSTERLLAFISGIVFVIAILVLAVFIPTPTPFQYLVFRIVLALAAAGFVSMTPGFLEITFPNWLRAGGALAILVIVYFYNPAALVATVPAGAG
jgi:hypothetical protein